MRNMVFYSFLSITLSACGGLGSDTIDVSHNKNIDTAIESATGPLQDLNLRQQEIPAILVAAANNPYGHSKNARCSDVKTELSQLDNLLGPDIQSNGMTLASANEGLLDHMSTVKGQVSDGIDKASDHLSTSGDSSDDNESTLPSGSDLLGDAGDLVKNKLMDTIHSQTNILPFRSIIRHLSGADAHQKKLAQAYEAGKLRRAYLKGFAEDHFGPQCLAKPIIVQATPAAIVAKADNIPDMSAH